MRIRISFLLLFLGLVAPAAQALDVVTDIEPVNAIVTQLAGGSFHPDHLVKRGSSGHDFALKPSMVARLKAADLIVWMGPAASPALANVMRQPGMAAKSLMLSGVMGTLLLHLPDEGLTRLSPVVPTDRRDPHSWLDPENALVWADAITAALAAHDPAQQGTYQAANLAFKAEVRATDQAIQDMRKGMKTLPYVQFHEAFQYFENRYDLHPLGIATGADEHATSLGVISDLRNALAENAPACLIVRDSLAEKEAASLSGIKGVRMGYANPLAPKGAGADFTYPELLKSVADGMFSCLGSSN